MPKSLNISTIVIAFLLLTLAWVWMENIRLQADVSDVASGVIDPLTPREIGQAIASPTPQPTLIPTTAPTATPIPDQRLVASGNGDYLASERAFVETFDGDPAQPLAWQEDATWELVVHSRDVDTWHKLEPVQAQHGPNCEPPPATHEVTAYQDTVYQCKNHMMTAISAEAYGLLYFTPSYMVDFSEGEAVIRWDVSTFRQSTRDWIDVWITPYQNNLSFPLERDLPDLVGEPQHAVHVRLDWNLPSYWYVEIIRDFEIERLDGVENSWYVGYEEFLEPDAKRRDVYELRISKDHVAFGMPDYDHWWVDTDITWLGWTEGVVQFGHHSYNPTKLCILDEPCSATTWHWDNIIIDPAIPFTIIHGDQRYVDGDTSGVIKLDQPAPTDAHLRFSGIGETLQVSFDGGNKWLPATQQMQIREVSGHFWSYWMPIPAGTTEVFFQGEDWWGGPWHVRDISVWTPE